MSKLLKALKHLETTYPENSRPASPLPQPSRSGVALHEMLDDQGLPDEAAGATAPYADPAPARRGQASPQSDAETIRLKEISLDALQLLLSEALATRESSVDTTASTPQTLRAIPAPEAAAENVPRRARLNQPHVISPFDDAIASITDRLLGYVKPNAPAAVLLAECGAGVDAAIAHVAARLQQTLAGEVLLIQSRPGNHVLERMLAVRNNAGLQEVVTGRRAIEDVVQSTSVPGLRYIGPGQPLHADGDLQANQLRPLAAELRDRFRMVLVYGGPADGVHALSWSQVCDNTFLMLQLGSVGARAAARSKRAMERAGARIAGCIAVDPAA